MFHRQPTEEALERLFPIKVYLDGRCLFRSVASRLEQRLLMCHRNDGGAPTDAISCSEPSPENIPYSLLVHPFQSNDKFCQTF